MTGESTLASGLPAGLASPAQRALAAAGYTRLEQLAGVREAEISRLHGIGPNALDQLRSALVARGLAFAEDAQSITEAATTATVQFR